MKFVRAFNIVATVLASTAVAFAWLYGWQSGALATAAGVLGLCSGSSYAFIGCNSDKAANRFNRYVLTSYGLVAIAGLIYVFGPHIVAIFNR